MTLSRTILNLACIKHLYINSLVMGISGPKETKISDRNDVLTYPHLVRFQVIDRLEKNLISLLETQE